MKKISFLVQLIANALCVVQMNAQQWDRMPGFFGIGVNCFSFSGSNIFAGSYQGGVFLSTNNGLSWTAVNSGLADLDVLALAVSGTDLFAGTRDGGVFRSTNNGTSWTAVNDGLGHTYRVDALVSVGTNMFAGAVSVWPFSGGVYRSGNNGTTWTHTGNSHWTYDFAVSGTILFAGAHSGVFLSTNDGTSWTEVNSGLVVNALAVSGVNLFAGTDGGGVVLSTNNGTSWTEVNSGLTDTRVNALAVAGTNLFAGTRLSGVFLTTNSGTSWNAVNTGLFVTYVTALAVNGPYLLAGTDFGYIFMRPLSAMITGLDDQKPLPVDFALSQNYPNPFNPSTIIRYALPVRSSVTLKIYNTLGQEVATLVQGEKEAGSHEVQFDATGLPSGVHYYRLTAGAFTDTRRMLLMK